LRHSPRIANSANFSKSSFRAVNGYLFTCSLNPPTVSPSQNARTG
jgi:hypothetical protein